MRRSHGEKSGKDEGEKVKRQPAHAPTRPHSSVRAAPPASRGATRPSGARDSLPPLEIIDWPPRGGGTARSGSEPSALWFARGGVAECRLEKASQQNVGRVKGCAGSETGAEGKGEATRKGGVGLRRWTCAGAPRRRVLGCAPRRQHAQRTPVRRAPPPAPRAPLALASGRRRAIALLDFCSLRHPPISRLSHVLAKYVSLTFAPFSPRLFSCLRVPVADALCSPLANRLRRHQPRRHGPRLGRCHSRPQGRRVGQQCRLHREFIARAAPGGGGMQK
jgi:hypothetical protein